MNLKGEMSMLNVLHLQELDIDAVCTELQQKIEEVPQFFMKSPLIVDCAELGAKIMSFDFASLKSRLLELGFIPVGIRNAPANLNNALIDSGWAIMNKTARTITEENSVKDNSEEVKVSQSEPKSVAVAKPSIMIERPVRSGQQIYAADADMTVLAPTSAGSEVMADGSIHIYGALRGRVLAGARGNESARIYCQSLQAELIAIAGRYQLLDEVDTELKGKPAMIRLEGEKLIIESLS